MRDKTQPVEIRSSQGSRRRKKAIAYTRTSVRGRGNFVVADEHRQLRHLQDRGFRRDQIIVENDHGAHGLARRPGFQRLLKAITSGRVGAVAISDCTRISRDPRRWAEFLQECSTRGVTVIVDGASVL
jgi:DNA invertase Pin-like site-specific DNA recombinase